MDIYPFENNIAYTKGIAQDQVNEAAGYTAGMLMAVSESLPPLIPDFNITAQAPVNGPAGAQILFTLLENRLPDVKIDLYVQETNQRIITGGFKKFLSITQSPDGTGRSDDYPETAAWSAKAVSLYGTNISDLSLLPQMADFRLDWSGEVAGEPLAAREEPYNLVLRVADHDGNISTATYKFTIMSDNTPPTVRWSGVAPDGTPVSQAVTGANTLETAPWFHIGYSTEAYINFWFDDYGTGVGNFSIYPPVVSPETPAPPALPMFSADFRNGQSFLLSEFTLSDDATGYRLTAADARGNATTVYFHLDRRPPEIAISTIVIHKVPGSYSIDVRGIAKDSVAGLAAPVKLSWMSGPTDQPPGPFWPAGPSEERFAFTGLQPAYPPIGNENNFMFYTFDKSGLPNYSYLPMSYEEHTSSLDTEWLSLVEIIPQLILGEVNFKVENPKPPANCSFIEPPAGMRAKVIVEPRTPSAEELATLNNWLSLFSDTYIENDYTPVSVPLTLYDFDHEATVSKDWDEVLPRFVRFSTEYRANTNSTRLSCPCSDGVGLCEASEPPGGYNYLTSGGPCRQGKRVV